jgi:hypothetical protein
MHDSLPKGEKYFIIPHSMSEGSVRKSSVLFEAYGVDNITAKGINLALSFYRDRKGENNHLPNRA